MSVGWGQDSTPVQIVDFSYSPNEVNLNDGSVIFLQNNHLKWKVSLIETGIDSLTGTRIKKLSK